MQNLSSINLIIGLGNPDPKYQNTYHNVGIQFIEYLKPLVASGYTLVASEVYMNESGRFVAQALKKQNAKSEELLIVHDDSDLELGKYKIQFGRGAAGHHGVENVQTTLKTKNFHRLRIGIRPPQEKERRKAETFVLKKITAADQKILQKAFESAATELVTSSPG